MNLFSELKIGEKLEIEPIREERRLVTNKNIIVSQLLDMKEDKLYISGPILKGAPYPLYEGNKIKIIFLREDRGIYSFSAEIKKKLQARLPIYVVSPISEAEKTQRRVFFRLEITRRVSMKVLAEEDFIVEGATKDISGGGIKIVARKPILTGNTVDCTLHLSDDCIVTIPGSVVRCATDISTGDYQLGISFIEGNEGARNRIVSFIFEKQRELRKKGLI